MKEDTHYFSSSLAKSVGVIEAVFLQEFYSAILSNHSMCIIEDGLAWFPCAIKDWGNYIDLWSCRQTDRIVKNCLSSKLLFQRHYDTDERRNRGWYAINPDIIPKLICNKVPACEAKT